LLAFEQLESYPADQLLAWAMREYGTGFAISTSFQKEGMVLVDMASRVSPDVRVFTLDTGRLPQETHEMIDEVRRRYGIRVEVVAPETREVEELVAIHGTNLFYKSVDLRTLCCNVRKVRPLARKLEGLKAWATGLRRSQGESRANVRRVELADGRVKLSPLADWSREQVEEYTRLHGVPEHPLYERGYTSIGCAPCTRAVEAGEGERAGRWWWELDANKECGIHFSPDGKVLRHA
jgi:thioredoxin-dependent adenylylsulfate APS reductase